MHLLIFLPVSETGGPELNAVSFSEPSVQPARASARRTSAACIASATSVRDAPALPAAATLVAMTDSIRSDSASSSHSSVSGALLAP
jgi:hypothetical protein